MRKSVLVVSWDTTLGSIREMLLSNAGYRVISAVGPVEAQSQCRSKADLLVLGHSVPSSEKKQVIACYRQFSNGPVLSLLRSGQHKLAEADYGVDAFDPGRVVEVVRSILHNEPFN